MNRSNNSLQTYLQYNWCVLQAFNFRTPHDSAEILSNKYPVFYLSLNMQILSSTNNNLQQGCKAKFPALQIKAVYSIKYLANGNYLIYNNNTLLNVLNILLNI